MFAERPKTHYDRAVVSKYDLTSTGWSDAPTHHVPQEAAGTHDPQLQISQCARRRALVLLAAPIRALLLRCPRSVHCPRSLEDNNR